MTGAIVYLQILLISWGCLVAVITERAKIRRAAILTSVNKGRWPPLVAHGRVFLYVLSWCGSDFHHDILNFYLINYL